MPANSCSGGANRVGSTICFWLFYLIVLTARARGAEHVIHISVDGLNGSVLQSLIDAGQAPNFQRLEDEGTWTLNARTDYSHTNTLPNHTTMLTARPVLQPDGMPDAVFHNWTSNSLPTRGATLHQQSYISSVFDVVHDAGMSTALYASKEKFVLFDQSYNETNGAPHARGRDKIDTFFFQDDGPPKYAATMNQRFLADMAARHFNYVFIHYRDPDALGHVFRFGGSAYRQEVRIVDAYLGDVLRLVEIDPKLKGKTTIILNTDHGGTGFSHINPLLRENYTIPIFVWGAGVGRCELYDMNLESRTDPGDSRPDYTVSGQPIRNGDTANLALKLLGLGPIPTSSINARQDLRISQ